MFLVTFTNPDTPCGVKLKERPVDGHVREAHELEYF